MYFRFEAMNKKNIVIIGAGNAGETLASEILTSDDSNEYNILCFHNFISLLLTYFYHVFNIVFIPWFKIHVDFDLFCIIDTN